VGGGEVLFHDWVFDTIPAAAWTKTKVWGDLLAEIACSNHAGASRSLCDGCVLYVCVCN
jgi:hypothetical protein